MDSKHNDLYRVVFQGKLVSDSDPSEVRRKLAHLFKAPPQTIERLFSGKAVVLKKGMTQQQAEKMQRLVAQCGAIVSLEPHTTAATISATNHPSLATDRRAQAKGIIDSFAGELTPVAVPLHYKLGIAATSAAMVLIPLIYLAIIAACGYLIAVHATDNTWLMHHRQGGRSGLSGLIAYLAPITIGAILILFMLKPVLLLFQRDDENPVELSPEREDDLFRFVHAICDKVKATRPCNIIVINEANAYAGFYRGMRGLLSNRLTLAIGLPLVAGMNTRQLAGILAHEFGHFAQGAGMRMTYLIRTINYWLYNSVYGRDRFDYMLDRWANNAPHLALMIVLQLARLFVWLTRKLLWLMMMAGQYISSVMMRQMEFDADRYEARLAGATQFADTSRRLNVLAYAAHELDGEMYELWSGNGFVLDDMPRAISDKADSYTPTQVTEIIRQCDERKAEVFDTHPADHQRIANAAREKGKGIFRTEAPARTLFAQYDKLCRQVTRHYYAYELQIKVKQENLLTLEQFKSRIANSQQDDVALEELFGGAYRSVVPLTIPQHDTVATESPLQQWRQLCQQQQQMQPTLEEALREYNNAMETGFSAGLAECYLDAGFSIKHAQFGLQSAEPSHVMQRIEESRDSEVLHYGQLLNYHTLLGRRLAVAGSLLSMPQLRSHLPEAPQLYEEFTRMRALQERLNILTPPLRRLSRSHALLNALLDATDSEEEFAQMHEVIDKVKTQCEECLDAIQQGVTGIAYPFEHSAESLNLYDYLFTSYYPDDELRTAYERGASVSNGLLSLLPRVAGRLCSLARTVEQACKLECPAGRNTRASGQR